MMQNETSADLDKAETHIFAVIYKHTLAWGKLGKNMALMRGDEMKDLLEKPTHSLCSFIPVHIIS